MDVVEEAKESQDAFVELARCIARLESRVKYLEKRIEHIEQETLPTVDDICKEVNKRMIKTMRNSGVAL